MGDRKLAQDRQRLIPAPLRFVRKDRGGGQHLAGRIDDSDLDAGAIAGIKAHSDPRAGRCGKQEIAQVRREYAYRFGLRRRPQPQPQIDIEMQLDLGAPRPARGFGQPAITGPALIGDTEPLHDLEFVGAGHAYGRSLRLRLNLQVENFFLLAAEQRQDPVRRQLVQRLAEIEIVLELLAFRFLAGAHGRCHAAAHPHLLAQGALQVGVLVKAFGEDRTRAVQRRGGVSHALLGIDEGCGFRQRIVLRTSQQQLGERLEPGLLGDLRLGAAFRLERRVDVFQAPLGVGGEDRRFERSVELALLANRIENRRATLFEFAQISQSLFERPQLRVVERAGQFLTVTGDERDGGAAVKQADRCLHLFIPNAKLLCNLSTNVCHPKSSGSLERPVLMVSEPGPRFFVFTRFRHAKR